MLLPYATKAKATFADVERQLSLTMGSSVLLATPEVKEITQAQSQAEGTVEAE